ncbi:MAG: MBL fold metallo-hydrolase [Ferroplasma sp.]|uniref:MBL fold metallo-hydrolase n=1 Tax=Ferroplasma sp. TaxID=2591003 RepID=UPI0028156B58|nr:MBL fold metallo-hydrolase [Ferroplasma sp.]WMT50914.1 MAG: MBL fold metallo-hydrolase [Ferroplasma sp.]
MNSIEKITVPIEIRALKTANIYHISGNADYIVDTGMSENSYNELKKSVNLCKIDFCIITHLHIDHIGGALYLTKNHGIPVYISRNDYDAIKYITDNRNEYFNDYRELMISNGVPEGLFTRILEGNPIMQFINYYSSLDLNILDNMNLVDTEIIDVPGHSPGSVAIYLKDIQAMITGDHVLKNISPNISVYSNGADYLGMYIESLKKIRKYDVKIGYPGHRDNIDDFTGRIDEIIQHHMKRIQAMTKGLKHQETAFSLASSIEWSNGRKLTGMNYMEQNFAIMETIAHLKYMENNGIIEKKYINGVDMYISTN